MHPLPTISVLVITYNQEKYIRQTLESIVCQEGSFRLELVVSNDCSSDKTDQVISDFIRGYNGPASVHYFAQESNLGILPNLIFALRQCTGEYLAICEGDDYWLSRDKLEKQLALFLQHDDCSMSITNRRVYKEDGSTYDELYDVFYGKETFLVPDIIEGFIPGTQTIFARNQQQLADYLFVNRDLTHADRYITYFFALQGKIYLLPELTAVYRMTGQGAWSANRGIRKLQVKAEQLEDFHRRIGLPLNNSTLAKMQLACWYATIKYCLKRPKEFRDPVNKRWIRHTWKKFRQMNRMNILRQVIFQS